MMELLKKINDILPRSDKWKLGVLLILMSIAAGLEVVGIGMILVFVSIIADPGRLADIPVLPTILDYFGIEGARDLLIYGSIGLIVVFVLKNIYLIIFHYIQTRFIHNRFRYIASCLYESYMNAPYVFHLDRNTAEMVRNVTVEAKILVKNVLKPLLQMSMEIVTALFIIIFLFVIEPVITFVVLVLIGGVGVIFLRFLKHRTQKFGAKALRFRSRIIQEVNEGLGGFKDISIMNRQRWFVDRFKSAIKTLSMAEVFKEVSKYSTKPVVETISVSGMLMIALILVLQGREIIETIPILTLFGVAAVRLMPALSNLVSEYNLLRYNAYSVNPVHNDLSQINYKIKKVDNKNIKKINLKKNIEIDNVKFSYPGSSGLELEGISLTIAKGSAVGIVGASGAGKTTLADIILGLLEPDSGFIKVDGIDIKTNIKGWQMNIGYIPQFIYLSDSTIRENIAFGLDESQIKENQVKKAVKAAQLDKFIDSLPRGLDTLVGERGVKLSGGQRQRIGIARALYHDPEVLVMDEATSSLDNRTERYIIEEIERLKGVRTIIIIAHRLTTIKNCDVLHVMKDGKVVASGEYEELIAKNNDFKMIADSETKEYE